MTDLDGLRRLATSRRYEHLSERLNDEPVRPLAEAWPRLKQLEKLVFFKLLDSDRAMRLYAELPFEEKYFLLLGYAPASVAPALEGLPPAARRLFTRLPEGCYDSMLKLLVGEEIDIPLTFDRN